MKSAAAIYHRRIALLIASVLPLVAGVLALSTTAALAESIEFGQRVVVVRDRAPILAGNATIDVVDRGDVLTVANIRQGWVLVSRGHAGWIDQAAVMPVAAAIGQFNQAVQQNPLDAGARCAARAAVWVEQHFWDAAVAEASEAVRQDPRLVRAWCVRSAALRGKKSFDAARADAQAAIALAPSWPHGYLAAADAWHEQGFQTRAVAAYSQVLERNRDNAHVMLRRGEARLATQQSNEWKLALGDFRAASELAEHDPACQRLCQLGRARAYIRQEDYPRALLEYKDLLNRNDSDVAALIGRGITYGQMRQYELALPALNDAVNLEPKNPLTLLARAEIRARQFNLRGALRDVDDALSLDATSCTAYRIRGEALAKEHKWEAAFEAFAQAIKLEPDNAAIYVARAQAYDAKKDSAAASADRQRVTEINAPESTRETASIAGKDLPRR